MKIMSAAVAASLASASIAQVAPGTHEDQVLCDMGGCGKAHAAHLRHQAGVLHEPDYSATSPYVPREAMTATDVLGYVLEMELDPATVHIAGTNTITVKSLVNNLTQFTFVLRSQFNVTSLMVNGSIPVTAAPPPANSYRRVVTLNRPYNAGEVFTLTIAYNGVPVSRGFGSIEFGNQNGNTTRPRFVASLSEAYFAATWWPCKDGDVFLSGDNSDKATIDLSVTAPDIYRTVSNGVLQSVTTPAPGKSKYRWVSNYPTATYLVAFSTTVYNTFTQNYTYPLPGGGTGVMPVEFNLYPTSDTPTNRAACAKSLDMLAAFRPYYGEYPFINEKYGIYQFDFGGGMEHQTNSGQTSFGESLTAHELAHQWWGDDVTCRTWNDIWLNEGFATYSEALWEEVKPGSTGLPAYLAAMVARKPTQVSDSVWCPNAADMNRIFSSTYSYRKGAWVLHQLRHVVGDATFYQILQQYRGAFQGSAATTDDFAAVASAVAGRDLTWFIDQWVYGLGAPAYALGAQPFTVNGQNYLRVSLRQTQDASWPGGGAPAGYFAAPIDLRVDTSTGPQLRVLNNNARAQNFVLPVTGTFSAATLDPDNWVLNTAKAAESYVQGPPVILGASPAPASSLASAPGSLQVTFSENVNAPAGSFTLTGPSGPVACSVSYSAATFTATVTPTGPLSPGAYTLAVTGVTAAAGGLALDAEVPGTMLVGQGPLPSGNGLAGGAASIAFTIEGAACGSQDFNGDGDFGTDQDIEAFFACLAGSCCPSCYAGGQDFNGDGDFGTDQDIEAFFRVLAGGTC